jgi:hypothetical protein
VVRNSLGKGLGMINALAIQRLKVDDSDRYPLRNFDLAGDRIIIFTYTHIYLVRRSCAIIQSMT